MFKIFTTITLISVSILATYNLLIADITMYHKLCIAPILIVGVIVPIIIMIRDSMAEELELEYWVIHFILEKSNNYDITEEDYINLNNRIREINKKLLENNARVGKITYISSLGDLPLLVELNTKK